MQQKLDYQSTGLLKDFSKSQRWVGRDGRAERVVRMQRECVQNTWYEILKGLRKSILRMKT